jgi:hypothetical protein
MGNYYCLVAGLPDVAFDGSKANYSIERFREELYPLLDEQDAKLVDLFFLSWDNNNILTMLSRGYDCVLGCVGCYSQERLVSIINSVKEGDTAGDDVPSYISDFLTFYFENEESGEYMWSDLLSARYYEYAMSVSNKFLASWFEFNLNVNNILVALLARKYKLSIADCVIGNNEVADALRSSSTRDFGLSNTVECFEQLVRLSENDRLHERERQLDEIRWKWLDDNSVFNYFTVERLYIFLQKLDMIERWAALDSDMGMQRYNELIEGLKSGAVFTDTKN